MNGDGKDVGAALTARVRRVCGEGAAERRWTLTRLCDDLGLVVDLQRASQAAPLRYQQVLDGRRLALALWLFELAIACGCHGLVDFAPTLLAALPGVDGSAFAELLARTMAAAQTAHAVAGGTR